MNKIQNFVDQLTQVDMTNVFNPYTDTCPIHDHPFSFKDRQNNLIAQLGHVLNKGVNTVWFGRDLGYRGGRRTGIALTDEFHLSKLAHSYEDSRIKKATATPLVSERTANVIWDIIPKLPHIPFLWNAFPFHPHETNAPFTNRCHTKMERNEIWHLNVKLLEILNPQKIIAIGNDAHNALNKLDIECLYVRHPSYGGHVEFLRGIRDIYGLPAVNNGKAGLQTSFTIM